MEGGGNVFINTISFYEGPNTNNVQHSLFVSDYDLQTALMEALCRMATPDQRKELADRWFSMQHVASAFVKICDSEFETVKACNLSHVHSHFVALQW